MNQWTFGWTALVAIGQILIVGLTAAAIWIALKPYRKSISLSLIYQANHGQEQKDEAILIANESTHTITLVNFGLYLNRYKIDTANDDIGEVNLLPLTMMANSHEIIDNGTIQGSKTIKVPIYVFLGFFLLGKENPYKEDKNPKVYFYVEDTHGKKYKHLVGRRRDIIEGYKKYRK